MRIMLVATAVGVAAAGIALAVGHSATQGGIAMFRGDAAHAGVYHTRGVRRFGGVQWRFKAWRK